VERVVAVVVGGAHFYVQRESPNCRERAQVKKGASRDAPFTEDPRLPKAGRHGHRQLFVTRAGLSKKPAQANGGLERGTVSSSCYRSLGHPPGLLLRIVIESRMK
jgi:hypothetical protein